MKLKLVRIRTERREVAESGIKGASKGAILGSAASIASTAAIVHTPVHLLWVIPTGVTAATISAPVVITAGVLGGVAGGGFAIWNTIRKHRKEDEEFEKLAN